jgi:antirestriction protein ArdC
MRSQSEIRQSVTDQLVQALQDGGLPPWRKCFSDDPNGPGLHTSLSTGKPYQGINQILLLLAGMRFNYKSRWWGTFNQIRFQNASVRKGERGHRVILWKPICRTRINQHGDEIDEKFLVMREFTVFNVEQTTGLDEFRVGYCKSNGGTTERYDEADRIIEATEAHIEYGGNQPAYRHHDDTIQMPYRHQFDTPESFYETIFHEQVHWSEKEGRVGRKEGLNYAFGELVAEIGACQLMAELHLPTTNFTNSASYIENWLRGVQNDSRFIFAASAQASRCVDYILAFSREPAETREPAIVI